MKTKQKSSLKKFMWNWPSWLIRTYGFCLLPLYIISCWDESNLKEAMEDWYASWASNYR